MFVNFTFSLEDNREKCSHEQEKNFMKIGCRCNDLLEASQRPNHHLDGVRLVFQTTSTCIA